MRSRSSAVSRAVGAVLLLASATAPALAQVDTASAHRSLFTWRDAVLAGGFTLGTFAIRPLDRDVAANLQRPDRQTRRTLHTAATVFRDIAMPGSVIIGTSLYAIGRFSSNERMAELGLYGTEALFVGEGAGSVLKDFFGRARPFADSIPNPDNWQLLRGFTTNDRYRSFPSGHTVAAFAAAAAVTSEASRWYPHALWLIAPTMYGGASFVGLARMYENRHWASDVIMGSAIGTFAGIKVVRYHRTHPTNSFDRWLLRADISPQAPGNISFSVLPMLR